MENPVLTIFFAILFIATGARVIFKVIRASKLDEEYEKEREKKYNRMKYLLENAISYMQDMEFLYDFTEDRDIDWTSEEILYYNIGYMADNIISKLESEIELEEEEI